MKKCYKICVIYLQHLKAENHLVNQSQTDVYTMEVKF